MNIIDIDQNLSVKNIGEFCSLFREELKKEETVTLDFSGLERMDFSIIQVLLSAQKSVRKDGKSFKLKGVGRALRKQLSLAGLIRKTGTGTG